MKKTELINKTSDFELYENRFVITGIERGYHCPYPEPDFMGTGKALVGYLLPGESLDGFKKRYVTKVKRVK